MKWPFWFPYPSSWLRALISMIWAVCFAYVFWIFGAWGLLIASLTDRLTILLISLLLAFLIGVYAYGRVCDAFVFKREKVLKRGWFISGRASWEGFLSLVIPALAMLNTIVALLPIHDYPISDYLVYNSSVHSRYFVYERQLQPQFQVILFGLLYISAAFLYQAECIVRHWLQTKRTKKAIQQTKKMIQHPKQERTLNPIEQELNQLKGQLGLTVMKDTRHSSRRRKR